MEVTVPQRAALTAMFERWNALSSMGSSRRTSFFVDGDGNFHPKVTINGVKPKVSDEVARLALSRDTDGHRDYDFDTIAWKLRENPELLGDTNTPQRK